MEILTERLLAKLTQAISSEFNRNEQKTHDMRDTDSKVESQADHSICSYSRRESMRVMNNAHQSWSEYLNKVK